MSLLKFLLFLAIYCALNGYLFIRGRQALPDYFALQLGYTIVFAICSLAVFFSIFLGNYLPSWLALTLEYIGGYYTMLFIYFLMAALAADILRGVDYFFHFSEGWTVLHYNNIKAGYLLVTLVFAFVLAFAGYHAFADPTVVNLKVPISQNKNSKSITIVAVSDLHLGHVIRGRRLAAWVKLINQQDPGVILFAGDIFDHNFKAVVEQGMREELLTLRAPLGIYAIAGNHDYYAGLERVTEYLKSSGVQVLRDQVVSIENHMVLIGRDDITNPRRKSLNDLLRNADTDLPTVVLDHQPVSLHESSLSSIDLHLSGHTHHGQVFPFNHIVSLIYPLAHGYGKLGQTHCYVSSGLGLWGAPMRLGTRSEIVVIRLTEN
jgi:hypothetical protein